MTYVAGLKIRTYNDPGYGVNGRAIDSSRSGCSLPAFLLALALGCLDADLRQQSSSVVAGSGFERAVLLALRSEELKV